MLIEINKDQPLRVSETNLTKKKLMALLEDQSEEGVDNPNKTKYYFDGSHDELTGRREKYKTNYALKHGLELLLIPSYLIHIGTATTQDKVSSFKPVIEDFVWALYLCGMRFLHYRTADKKNEEVIKEMLPSDEKLIDNILYHLNKTCNPKAKKKGKKSVKVPNLKFCDDISHCRWGYIGEIRGVQAVVCMIEFRHWLVVKIGEKLGDPYFALDLVYEEDDESLIEESKDNLQVRDFSDDEMEDSYVDEMEDFIDDETDSRVRFYAPGGKVEIEWEEQMKNLHACVDQLHLIKSYIVGHADHTMSTIKVEEPLRKLLKSYIGVRVFRMRDFFLSVSKTILLELYNDMVKRGVASGIFVMADDGQTPEGDECLLVKKNIKAERPRLKLNYYNNKEKKRYLHGEIELQVLGALLHPDQDIQHRYAGQKWAVPLSASHTCKRKTCIGSHICGEDILKNIGREPCFGGINDAGVLTENRDCKHRPRCVNILYINQDKINA